ncbi:MAG TPA: alpha/beta fold hydrolase [Phycisphaerales bacterium]|nr:alpha/beta fold hydrolase [Phycisphaerales bacterium]
MDKGVGTSPSPWRGLAKRLILLPLIVVGVLQVVSWTSWAESRVFYHPSRERFETPPGATDVTFRSEDGVELHGWLLLPIRPYRADDGRAPERFPVVLHCHGNAGNISSHLDFSSFLVDRGVAVFIFDYRGYGRSEDARGLARGALLKDSRAALNALLMRPEIDPARVGVLGVSLGGVFATALAVERDEIRAVCTVSAFSSWRGIAGDHLPVLGPLLLSNALSPRDSLREMSPRPVLLVHGDRDEIIGIEHMGVLEKAARAGGSSVAVHTVPGGDHNGVLFTGQGEQDVIADFFIDALAVRE